MDANSSLNVLPETDFGPSASGRFDFTVLFENVMLSIVPSVLFFVLAPQRLLWLKREPRKIVENSRLLIKLGLITIYTGLQLVVLTYWTVGPLPTSQPQIAAAALVFANGLLLALLSYVEHTRSVRPSTIINVYLFFTSLFDCAIARTLWLLDGAHAVARLFTAATSAKALILVSEAWEKRSILRVQYRDLSPETTSGILGRSVFWWINPLMKLGFSNFLTEHDLYAIENSLLGKRLFAQVERSWRAAVRGSLISLIYDKTLDLSITAFDESIAVTLMSADTENICMNFASIHEMWASPIECGVALYLLYRQLGMAFLAPMVVAIVSTTGILMIAKYIANAQKRWVRGIQTRIDVTASMLGSMKEVKMLGLTDVLNNLVQSLRVRELDLSKKFRKLMCWRVLFQNSMEAIAPLATFATYVVISQETGNPLSTASAYTSLSLIYLLSNPMSTLIRTIPGMKASLACFDRMQGFLLSDSCKDHRLPLSVRDSRAQQEIRNFGPRAFSQDRASIELLDRSNEPSVVIGQPLMIVSDASFGWSKTEAPVLSNISFPIRKSHFTFVIGSVGSGKSTLMKALLGELQPYKGFVYTDARRIAFVDQKPWIQNLTIRQNILGISTYHKDWYDRVVHACGLEQDIAEMPDKDATKAGSGGVSLSGGQNQRLALARAIHSKAGVLILDDVFSGQDASTEEHIYRMLFSETGLLKELGTTVVCVTNAIHRLAYADHVVALSEHGTVQHQGTFEQLKNDTDYFSGLHLGQNGAAKEDGESSTANKESTSAPQGPEEETESANRALGELATYGYYFNTVPKWHVLLLVALTVLFGAAHKMTELLLSFWTGHSVITQQSVNNFYLGLYSMLAGLAIIGIMGAAVHYLVIMVPLSSEVLHARLLRTVMNAPLSFFSRMDVGVTTNRFSRDMSVIDTELPFALIDLAIDTSVTIMAVILMCVFSGYFVATLPPLAFFCWLPLVLQRFYLRTSRQIRILELQANSPLFTQFLDTLQGLSSVRSFGWVKQFKEQHFQFLDASQRPYYLLFSIQRWLAVILDLAVAALATILMVLIVKLRDNFEPKFVAMALLNVTSFSQYLTQLIKNYTQLETSLGAVSRTKEFCSTTDSENLPGEVVTPPESWPSHGHVQIENLTAAYTTSGEPVLHEVSLDISAGFKVGVVGRSGSGKSSLMACLLRMLEVDSKSSIKFDGIDITTLPRQTVRASVAVVPQHPFFMKKTTVRDNLVPRGEQPEERILAVLKRLRMKDAVEKLGGLDSILDVERLSQGQRQLLCLARAILANKKIIFLDEASSNVDAKSEQLIRQVVQEEFVGCTVIAIAHRLGAVVDFDRVAVMGGGRVIEWDNPRELLKKESEFKRLWDLSSG
ncbi:P-loop containing nucleoside triphosphate hydrolase protein [Fusarium oxysporum Fo47]|uniref:P-loop containing nucleoside triphosphate hydrolase protein n=1 Tax=Fusarium oxysporum Fo47 TaxID=660027 RepID=UPI002869B9C0|nr:P-loop containing nucleoside triphosphate hydrolase protein [Fusarium oxysporum Fo47]QKD49139.2 P-loop containing nucleoside triphosphate hydrolase protein [Fusarium oxysporum Fo47]